MQHRTRAEKQHGSGRRSEQEVRAEDPLVDAEPEEVVSVVHSHALEHESAGRVRSQVSDEDRAGSYAPEDARYQPEKAEKDAGIPERFVKEGRMKATIVE